LRLFIEDVNEYVIGIASHIASDQVNELPRDRVRHFIEAAQLAGRTARRRQKRKGAKNKKPGRQPRGVRNSLSIRSEGRKRVRRNGGCSQLGTVGRPADCLPKALVALLLDFRGARSEDNTGELTSIRQAPKIR